MVPTVGRVLTIAGLVLAGRSIVREGRGGVGAKSSLSVATVTDSYYDEFGALQLKVKHAPDTLKRWREEDRGAAAAVIGLVFALLGTAVWGYGDLLGRLR